MTAYGGNRWHRNLVFGLRSAPRPPIDLVTAYGGSKVTVLRKVAVPTAMPAFFASSRIAVPGSLIGGADRGMARHRSGHRGAILRAIGRFRYSELWASVVVLTTTSILRYTAVGLIEAAVLARYFPNGTQR